MTTVIPTFLPIDGGFRLPELATDTHHIDILRMLFTWRLVEVPRDTPYQYDRFWCYEGGDPIPAVLAAVSWYQRDRCAQGTEPTGWVRSWDRRRRGRPVPSEHEAEAVA